MKKFLVGLLAIIVVLIVIGAALPTEFTVERSVVIASKPNNIHPYVEDLTQWPKWAPWQDADPTIETKIGSIAKGIGASQSWQGESGSGELHLTKSDPNSGIHYDMSFGSDTSTYDAGLRYEVVNEGTKVTWYMNGNMEPVVIGGYFALLMDAFVGDMFYQGLVNLKQEVEKAPRG